jgi:hypothetical protein
MSFQAPHRLIIAIYLFIFFLEHTPVDQIKIFTILSYSPKKLAQLMIDIAMLDMSSHDAAIHPLGMNMFQVYNVRYT